MRGRNDREMPDPMAYRAATGDDARAIAALGEVSFVEAFGHLYAAQDLAMFLRETYTYETATSDLANPDRLFRIAELNGKMLGYCKLGFDRSLDFDFGTGHALELKQLYIRGAATGGGVGSELMKWAIAEAKLRGFSDVILSVWAGNHAAQRFYTRHGFKKIGDTIFRVGNHCDEEYLMGLTLRD